MRLDHITPKQFGVATTGRQRCTHGRRLLRFQIITGGRIRLNSPKVVKGLPGGNGKRVPPDPIPNSEVKLLSADDSVGFPHVKVGHCQALNTNPSIRKCRGVFLCIWYLTGQCSLPHVHVLRDTGTSLSHDLLVLGVGPAVRDKPSPMASCALQHKTIHGQKAPYSKEYGAFSLCANIVRDCNCPARPVSGHAGTGKRARICATLETGEIGGKRR